MFADYGILALFLAVVCFAALKCIKLEGLAYKLVKMLAFCGISTFIWGALFGGFFGNIITVISETFFGHAITIKPLWFDPLADPMKMLIFSCVIGGVHLLIGMGVNAYLLLRDGKVLDAIESVFVWYAFLIGVVLLLFGGSLFDGAQASASGWPSSVRLVSLAFRYSGARASASCWVCGTCTAVPDIWEMYFPTPVCWLWALHPQLSRRYSMRWAACWDMAWWQLSDLSSLQ